MKRRGFTLIELIITVGIIVFLAVISFVSLNPAKRIGEANDAQRNADLVNIAKALEFYAADNANLPSDFASSNIGIGHKVVICSAAANLSCDGQTRDCLVIDDVDFLKEYLPSFPIDPIKIADTDTGYYITRINNDMTSFGACDSYQAATIEVIASIELPAYIPICGDGEVEGSEVCDDNNEITETQSCGNGTREYGTHCNANCSAEITLTEVCDDNNEFTEGCGNGVIEAADTYCNANCSAEIVIATSEKCDYNSWTNDCNDLVNGWITTADAGSYLWCSPLCDRKILACVPIP